VSDTVTNMIKLHSVQLQSHNDHDKITIHTQYW